MEELLPNIFEAGNEFWCCDERKKHGGHVGQGSRVICLSARGEEREKKKSRNNKKP